MKVTRHPIIEGDLEEICSQSLPWSLLEGKRVLVTGAAGMLPAYLVETLLYLNETGLNRSAQIVGMVRTLERAAHRFAAYANREDLRLVEHDVCREFEEDSTFDFILHAASPASPAQFGRDPVATLTPNTIGTYHLLEMARRSQTGVLLFFSSGEVYGEIPGDPLPVPEHTYGAIDPVDIRACYAESKRMGEAMCSAWSHQHGVETRIVRPFHTYGPHMPLRDGRVFSDFVADVLESKDIVMKSDGKATRTYCYLADATAAFFAVLLLGAVAEPYNVGSGFALTVRELAELLIGLVPEKQLSLVQREPSPSSEYLKSPLRWITPDVSKIRRLGWQPRTLPNHGFLRTLRSFS
jgi:nucleoside-diphosphate-sugar epimerase